MAEHDRTPPARSLPAAAAARFEAARKRVAREARKSRGALALERVARAFWPVWALVAAFLGAALLGLPQALPFWGHVALLAGTALALAAAIRLGVRAFRWPTRAEARARLDAEARERPVAALDDALAANAADPATRRLWEAHRARMAEKAAQARAAPADMRVSREDRFALRHAALIALCAGVIAQLGTGGARLAEALTPSTAPAAVAAERGPTLEAWASPPVHTGAAPIYLTERAGGGPIELPVGTEIVLRVFDSDAAPTVETDAAEPARRAAETEDGAPAPLFAETGDGVWDAALRLTGDGTLSASAEGAALGAWRFGAIPDAPPEIAFTEEPRGARSGALEFAFETSDDYGVVSARAVIRLDADAADPPGGFARDSVFESVEFPLPLPLTGDAEAAAEEVVEDLVAHPFAGLPVVITLIAEDGAGQTGRAQARMTMPERRFFEPLAKAIIEQRRVFSWSLQSAERVDRVLRAVSAHPEDVFEDMTAYLTLRTALRRLTYAIDDDRLEAEADGIVELLWEVALRIEDGDLSEAERRLRQVQEELSEALENGAPEDEIAELMQELREALNEYLQQRAQEALRDQANGQQQQQQPIDPDQMLTQRDLDDMLNALEEALRSGMEDMARQMLQQLQQMLENLQMAQPGQQQGQGQGDQAMQELQDMIGEQQGLADRSFDALRQGQQQGRQGQQGQQGQNGQQQGRSGQGRGQPGQGDGAGSGDGQGRQLGQGQPQPGRDGQPGGPDLGAIARDQEALRRLLEDLRQGLPGEGGGEALGRAEERMGDARDSLDQGDADGALQNQVEALDALREGAQDLARQQQQQPGQAQQAGRDGRSGDVRDEDPFGRPTATDGPLDGDSVQVPDAGVMKRARELMDEIRRRAGERTRPSSELEYLERLLDRF